MGISLQLEGAKKEWPIISQCVFLGIGLQQLQLNLLIHRLIVLSMLAGACLPRAFCQHAGKRTSAESQPANQAIHCSVSK